jgi:hypothetical protein
MTRGRKRAKRPPPGGKKKHDLEKWYRDVERLVAKIDPKDIEIMEAVINEADAQAKAIVRREMGLN